MTERPCAAPSCATQATERRFDRRRRAAERLHLCLEHAAQHDRMTGRPRPSSAPVDFDPDDTGSSPFAAELEGLEAREAELLKTLRAVQTAIRSLRALGTT